MNTFWRHSSSKPSHSKTDKLKEISRNLDPELQRDRDEFEKKIFGAKKFSEIQK